MLRHSWDDARAEAVRRRPKRGLYSDSARFRYRHPGSAESWLGAQLAAQQIDFLEVPGTLTVLEDQLHESGFQGAADALYVVCPVPLVSGLPAVDGLLLLVQVIGNISDAPTGPVQELGVSALVGGRLGCSVHDADADAHARAAPLAHPVAHPPTKPPRCRTAALCGPCPHR